MLRLIFQTKIYEIVVATQKAKLEEGEYRHTYTSVTNKIEITDLLSCEPYFFAVRSKSPYSGPLSIPVHTRTLEGKIQSNNWSFSY